MTVEIKTLHVTGVFPRRALGLVLEWGSLRATELLANWERARLRRPLQRIASLE